MVNNDTSKVAPIPYNRPFIVGRELDYIAEAVAEGHLSGNGTFTKRCCRWIEETFKIPKAILAHSCTGALEMAAILADIGPGDEVILPSYTFVSTANAFILRGAVPKFIDVRSDTLNIDERLIEEAISDRTKAIVPVHYAGVACEMDSIMAIAGKRDILVIEDAAQAVDATYKGRFLGSIGDMGTYSFHETKNYISGEGGALAVNRDRFVSRASIIRDKGTNREAFEQGEVDRYTWVDVGSSFLPSELVAAFLYAQLEEAHQITKKRMALWNGYFDGLVHLQDKGVMRLPYVPDDRTHNAHLFYLMMNSNEERDALIRHLRSEGILAIFHYIPLHTSPMGKKFGYKKGDLEVTERVAENIIRLPIYHEMTAGEQERVIRAVEAFFE